MGCKFCASGLLGLKRDLNAGEIVAQLLQVCYREDAHAAGPHRSGLLRQHRRHGHGRAAGQLRRLIRALTIVNADWGFGFGARRITLSTSGLVPQILRLAEEPLGFRLAISLHGATDEVREQIMPVNRAWPLEKLIPAVRTFSAQHGRMVTLEFILIEDVNDALTRPRNCATSRSTCTPTSTSSPTTGSRACRGNAPRPPARKSSPKSCAAPASR